MIMHELGHALGINHLEQGDVMYSAAMAYSKSLSQNDLASYRLSSAY